MPRDRRDEAYALRNFITAQFGRDGWDCTDHPPAEGETPVMRTFIKQDCRKAEDVGREPEVECGGRGLRALGLRQRVDQGRGVRRDQRLA